MNYRTIKKAYFHEDKQMVHRTRDERKGRVEITYEDDSIENFLGIDRGQFYRWASTNFRGDLAPDDIVSKG